MHVEVWFAAEVQSAIRHTVIRLAACIYKQDEYFDIQIILVH